jgi:hypothetical protein
VEDLGQPLCHVVKILVGQIEHSATEQQDYRSLCRLEYSDGVQGRCLNRGGSVRCLTLQRRAPASILRTAPTEGTQPSCRFVKLPQDRLPIVMRTSEWLALSKAATSIR